MTEIDSLIQKALNKALDYRNTPIPVKHSPRLTVKTISLNSPKTKKALRVFLEEYRVVSIRTNGWWVSFLFGK